MARNKWHEALAKALEKEETAVIQLATIEATTGRPRVRSLVHRAFLTATAYPTLPLILSTTDVRSPKVTQLAANKVVEAVYWIPSTQEQFRILGRAWVMGHLGDSNPKGLVYDALRKEGFDWEKKRVETFDRMSAHMKATWCRPTPGTPLDLVGGEERMRKWPERLPRLGEARDEEEGWNLEMALGNFALLVIEPFEVDYVELGVKPERRTKFERCWENDSGSEGGVEFRERVVVP